MFSEAVVLEIGVSIVDACSQGATDCASCGCHRSDLELFWPYQSMTVLSILLYTPQSNSIFLSQVELWSTKVGKRGARTVIFASDCQESLKLLLLTIRPQHEVLPY